MTRIFHCALPSLPRFVSWSFPRDMSLLRIFPIVSSCSWHCCTGHGSSMAPRPQATWPLPFALAIPVVMIWSSTMRMVPQSSRSRPFNALHVQWQGQWLEETYSRELVSWITGRLPVKANMAERSIYFTKMLYGETRRDLRSEAPVMERIVGRSGTVSSPTFWCLIGRLNRTPSYGTNCVIPDMKWHSLLLRRANPSKNIASALREREEDQLHAHV